MKDLKRFLPSVLISAILIALIFRFFDVPGTLRSFSTANALYLTLAVILGLAWMIARTFVWRTLLKQRAGFMDTFITLNEGYLLNNVLPFRLGEVGRAVLLSQKTDLKFIEVLSTIFVERVTDIAFSAIILLAALPFIQGAGDIRMVGWLAIVAVVVFFGVIYISIKHRDGLLSFFGKTLGKIPKGQALVDNVLVRLLEGLDVFSDIKVFFAFIFYMMINWSISIVQYTLIIAAFFPQATVVWGMFTLGAAAFGGAIPSLPGGVGTLEGSMGGAVLLLTGDKAASLAVPLFLRGIMYLFSGLFGIYGLTTEGRSLKSIYETLRNTKTTPE